MSLLALTGATGLLGRAVLRATDRPVRALVRPGSAPPPGVQIVVGDLADERALASLVRGADCVLHLATAMGAGGPDAMRAVNVQGTERLLRHAGATRVVFTSSVAARDPSLGPYAASKAEAEELVLAAGGVVLRLPVLYGPGTQVERAVLGLGRLPLLPAISGADIRPLHVDDAAATCLVAASEGQGRYTLSGPDALSFPDFAALLLRRRGARARPVAVPARPLVWAASLIERLLPGSPISAEGLRAAASGTPETDLRARADLGFAPRSLADRGFR